MGVRVKESLNNVVDIINKKMITNVSKNSKESSKTRDKTINDLTNILNKNIYNSNGELIRIKGSYYSNWNCLSIVLEKKNVTKKLW